MELEQMTRPALYTLIRRYQSELAATQVVEAGQTDLIAAQVKVIEAKQSEIDRLMLEFCPGEMSAEQMAAWEASQREATSHLPRTTQTVTRYKIAAPQQHAQTPEDSRVGGNDAQAALSDELPDLTKLWSSLWDWKKVAGGVYEQPERECIETELRAILAARQPAPVMDASTAAGFRIDQGHVAPVAAAAPGEAMRSVLAEMVKWMDDGMEPGADGQWYLRAVAALTNQGG